MSLAWRLEADQLSERKGKAPVEASHLQGIAPSTSGVERGGPLVSVARNSVIIDVAPSATVENRLGVDVMQGQS